MNSILLSPDILHRMPLPEIEQGSDKHERGRALIIGSSPRVPGALLLCGIATLRAGAGSVQLAVPSQLGPHIGMAFPEAGIIGMPETGIGTLASASVEVLAEPAETADAILIGPGVMDHGECASLAHALMERIEASFVLDAAALTGIISKHECVERQNGNVILTPHAGEMARMLGLEKQEVESAPDEAARSVSQRLNCIVALKGATTYIAAPDGALFRNEHGAVGLGTAGSGDVLAGLITGMLARGASPLIATLWGVYAHAHIGTVLSEKTGPLGFLAREIADEIPATLAAV